MIRKTALIAFTLLVLAVGAAYAGPDLDRVLNYMFMDQSVPMKNIQLQFNNQREIVLTKDSPIGQTFVTSPETGQIGQIRAFLAPTENWKKGEGAEMTIWDSPEKKTKLGSNTIWFENRSFHYLQAEWPVGADVKPNSTYYLEISYAGEGDGKLGKVGVMNGADNYKPGQGYLAGKQGDFDICFQTHARRAPDAKGNLKKMFARLDLDRPGLEEVKKAVAAEDFETAIAKTVAYFEARTQPFAILRGEKVTRTPNYDTSLADSLMNATVRDGSVDMEGFEARKIFTNAYLNTGDEKYAKKLNDLLIDWYITYPAPSLSKMDGCGWDDEWPSLSVGLRIGHGFVAYSRIASAKSFSNDCRLIYIVGLADHCNTLVGYGADAGGNWSFTQNSSMLMHAMNFPEFKESAIWQQTAIDRLTASIKVDMLPDGAETESAFSYQRMAYNPLANGVYDDLIAKRGLDTPFSRSLKANLEGQAEYFMYAPMPNGVTPWMGDWAHEDMRGYIMQDAQRFARRDMVYVATSGKYGEKPKELSKLYPYAGVVTMRSDWGDAGRPYEDARYLLIHGVHYGAHGHQDLNGISGLYAYGRELLTDPGSHEYGSQEHFQLTTAPSHSLMTIDGEDQNRRAKTYFGNWSTTPIADYLSSFTGAYKGGDYNREVFFIRSNGDKAQDYWIVRDTATGSGTHSLEQRWRYVLDTPMKVDQKTLTTWSEYETGGNLAIMQVDPSKLKLEETTTDTWGNRAKTSMPPAKLPTVIYTAKTPLPAAIDTVLFPFEGKPMPGVQLKTLETSSDGLASIFTITQGNVEDMFVLQRSAQKTALRYANVSFDGDRLVIRRVNGKLRSAFVANGSFLKIDGQTAMAAPKRQLWMAVSFDADEVKAYTSSGKPDLRVSAKGDVTVLPMAIKDVLQPPAAGDGETLLIRKSGK